MAVARDLLTWYAELQSRTVDLVGDYAGDELFIIEGDSLLRHLLSDNKLDFSPGLQLLHATYLVENFLYALHHRQCNFHLVFFKRNAHLCVPPHIPDSRRHRYLLARQAVICHLLHNLHGSIPSIQVNVFASYEDEDFVVYLKKAGVYFLMCHDGASPEGDAAGTCEGDSEDSWGDDEIKEDSAVLSVESNEVFARFEDKDIAADSLSRGSSSGQQKVAYRSMINWFIGNGYNVALINGLAWRDTKVMAMIVEGPADTGQHASPAKSDTVALSSNMESVGCVHRTQALHEILDKLNHQPFPSELSRSERIVAVSLSIMFKSGAVDRTRHAEPWALLVQAVFSHACRLSDRVIYQVDSSASQAFLDKFAEAAYFVLAAPSNCSIVDGAFACDVGDLIDGRLFLHLVSDYRDHATYFGPDLALNSKLDSLIAVVEYLSDVGLSFVPKGPERKDQDKKEVESTHEHGPSKPILPFHHSVFDAHLESVKLTIDESATASLEEETSKVFRELSHWHNHRRTLEGKGPAAMTEKQAFFASRRNQFFMAEMRDYAGSLTNAQGGILKPETIFVRSSNVTKQKGNHSKPATRNIVAAANEKRKNELIDKQLHAWMNVKADLDKESDLATRFVKVNDYFASLPTEKRVLVQPETLTYSLSILVEMWINKCAAGERDRSLHIAALIWDTLCRISKLKDGVTHSIAASVAMTVKAMQLPAVEVEVQSPRKSELMSVFASLESGKKQKQEIELSPTEFQLLHAGPFFDRNMDSAPDPRVHDFEPDKWQRDVLDGIDAGKSLFVVAPTSAGKTFISFYAMKKVLEGDDDGVLVYVAPTKALVNQIAAEIQARFTKSFKYGTKSVWAIHTRDYRINSPTGCQVLVTVPHILQIMLLGPTNARMWSPRVKRIIFDEIHSIGQVDDGVVWEQLLLLSPCPIIALSATVGNPEEFSKWLATTQEANDIDLKVIEHHHRYSDLRKYVYYPPKKFCFNGLLDKVQFPQHGLDGASGLAFMHPVASLVNRLRGIPKDLTLEARDCWMLWSSMKRYQTADFPLDDSLDPAVFLPGIIRKVDVIRWEERLKSVLNFWLQDSTSPFQAVVDELQRPILSAHRSELQVSARKLRDGEVPTDVDESKLLHTTLPLVCSLHDQGALPALFFNYDRRGCELICHRLLVQLERAENAWKQSSPEWKAKLRGWEEWKKSNEKLMKRKGLKQKPKNKNNKHDEDDNEMSKEERMRETASAEWTTYEAFDPEAPVNGFHLADVKKVSPSTFQDYVSQLENRGISKWLINALRRGIGVHHAGMNRKYRQVCEILFRKGYLRVVVATGTLALGINMPCKTVVFSGDSIYLTALNFRQAAGRAGRRGFDMLGNVVFQGIPYHKVCRLLSSRLPDLSGHFPITTTLVLRLFTLLHDSGQAPNTVRMINSLLSCSRLYLGGPAARDTVLHHLRFSIEYLRRNHLLDQYGKPLNFAGCIQHLYYVENASFAFHSLLKNGFFHRLCQGIVRNPNQVLLDLMLVMSHIFGRVYLRQSVLERAATSKCSSVVVLPPLPREAATILHAHNKETLDIYIAYVKTYVAQHIRDVDHTLPLTCVKCGGDAAFALTPSSSNIPAEQRINSAFVALSGHRDKWESIPELCKMLRSGVWLEPSVVPYVGVHPEKGTQPLNAYLFDFFKHGNVHALERDNGVRKGDVWFLLNDFSLVLATIVTSFENFFKLSPASDDGMLNVMGGGDAHEAEADQTASESSRRDVSIPRVESLPMRQKPVSSSSTAPAAARKKEKVAESWDDDLSDENGEAESISHPKEGTANGEISHTEAGQQTGRMHASYSDAALDAGASDLREVLSAFKMLQDEFNQKFKAMWA